MPEMFQKSLSSEAATLKIRTWNESSQMNKHSSNILSTRTQKTGPV